MLFTLSTKAKVVFGERVSDQTGEQTRALGCSKVLCIYDKGRYGIAANTSLILQTTPSEIISLIPQPEAIITSHNLKWKLTNEELKLGSREGARNRAAGNEITIEIHSGELLIFFESRIPSAPGKSAYKI